MRYEPTSEAEVAEAVRASSGLRVEGGGTRPIGITAASDVLSTRALSGITLYEPGALTLRALAGTPMAQIEAALAGERQRLAFEPMDHRGIMGSDGGPTIGGAVAVGASGPRRVQAGSARDALIGLRFVTGEGMAVASGGRVMKNVTGYDLVKLLAGSHGTLGVMTELTFKLLPAPEAQATLVLEGLGMVQAMAAMTTGLTSPYEVTGAAHLPGGEPRTCLRIEGLAGSVAHRTTALAALLQGFGMPRILRDPEESARLWEEIRDVEDFAGHSGDIWRISLRPSQASQTVARLGASRVQLDWGGGLIWALVPVGTDLRARIGAQGHATLIRASTETKARLGVFPPEPPGVAVLSKRLRERFDPLRKLNPGTMARRREFA